MSSSYKTIAESLARLAPEMSERGLVQLLGISRTQWRAFRAGRWNPTWKTLQRLSKFSGSEIWIENFSESHYLNSELSTVGVSAGVMRDGFNSWKIHFMDFVDEFRRTKDRRLLILPPLANLDPRLRCLLGCIVVQLCHEVNMAAPDWAVNQAPLKNPWFVSEIESLKAIALTESPIAFRIKNIFVFRNFLDRI